MRCEFCKTHSAKYMSTDYRKQDNRWFFLCGKCAMDSEYYIPMDELKPRTRSREEWVCHMSEKMWVIPYKMLSALSRYDAESAK